jgi:MFS family permease
MAVPKLNLMLDLICRDYFSDMASKDPQFTYLPVIIGDNNPQCRIPEVQTLVSRFILYYNLVTGLLASIVSPRLGSLSDRYGRKKLMAINTVGVLIGEIFTIIVAAKPEEASVKLLLVGAFFDGLFGSFTTGIALVHAYAADCSAPESRNVVFGYFHGVLFSGLAFGPFIFGLLIKLTGMPLVAFYAVTGCHAFYFLMLVSVIPESVSKERQRIAREKHRAKLIEEDDGSSWAFLRSLNPANLFKPLQILFPKLDRSDAMSPDRRKLFVALRRNLVVLASIDTLLFGVAMGAVQITLVYAEYMYGWGNYESSIFVGLANTVRVVNLLLVLPMVTRLIRGPPSGRQVNTGSDMLDIGIIRLSILFDLAGYIGYATVRKGGLMTLSAMIAAIGGMGSPTLQSALTKHVPPGRTGQILGATGLLHALSRVISPTVFSLVYGATVGKFPQAVFVCLASVFGLVFILSWFIQPNGTLSLQPGQKQNHPLT